MWQIFERFITGIQISDNSVSLSVVYIRMTISLATFVILT